MTLRARVPRDWDEPRCCGCCAPVRRGLVIYVSIFLALNVLGLFHFAPVPYAMLWATFIMDDIVNDAKQFCSSEEACKEVCDGNMEDLARPARAGLLLLFFLYLINLGLFGVCAGAWPATPLHPSTPPPTHRPPAYPDLAQPPLTLAVGACQRNAKLLKVFIVGLPIVLLSMIIPGLVRETASSKPFWAWYLQVHSAGEFKDENAECTQKWVDEATTWEVLGSIINWVSYIIGSSIGLHIVYTAHCARAPRGCHESAARGVRASLEWWARSGPGWLVVGPAGWRCVLLSSPHLTPATSHHRRQVHPQHPV